MKHRTKEFIEQLAFATFIYSVLRRNGELVFLFSEDNEVSKQTVEERKKKYFVSFDTRKC